MAPFRGPVAIFRALKAMAMDRRPGAAEASDEPDAAPAAPTAPTSRIPWMSDRDAQLLRDRRDFAQRLWAEGVRPAVSGAFGPLIRVPPNRLADGRADRLRVLITGEGQNVFDHIRDPRVSVGELSGVGGDDAPDILVVPRPEREDLASVFNAIPAPLWARVAAGLTGLVLDGSTEGSPHDDADAANLHQMLAARGVQARNTAHITQDRLYEDHYWAFCEARGLQPVRILNYDYFIRKTAFSLHGTGEEVFEWRLKRSRKAARSDRRRFLSLNFTPRPHKVLFLIRLLQDELWDQGLISFGGFSRLARPNEVTKGRMAKSIRRLEAPGGPVGDPRPWLDRLDDMGSFLFGIEADTPIERFVKKSYLATDMVQYRQSWFSVVTETDMYDRVHRITEKTFKPMLNLHPFIVLGCPGSLGLVREYGFQTFEGLFDETYDQEPDSGRRFEMVYAEVNRLIRMDEAELDRLVASFEEIVTFNARWGLVELPRIFEERIDTDLVDTLIDLRSAD